MQPSLPQCEKAQSPAPHKPPRPRKHTGNGITRTNGRSSMPGTPCCFNQSGTTRLPPSGSTISFTFSLTTTNTPQQYILLGLILSTSLANATEFDFMTPQVLTSDKTQFSIGPTNFYAIDTPNAKLIYSTSLEESRQIYAISRTLDYTQVGVANENLHLSLTHLTQQNYLEHLDNYRFYIDTEIHLSPNRVSTLSPPLLERGRIHGRHSDRVLSSNQLF